MKVKVKDEMNDIRLKCSFDEAIIIKEALEYLSHFVIDDELCSNLLTNLNMQIFDAQEFEGCKKFRKKLNKMIIKISNKTNFIDPY